MSTVDYDGQSFFVDGRRIWLVSAAIHYPRTPQALWRARLRAAREAGINCIETYCFWNAHEPRPGQFRFDGDLDLRRFVQMVGEEGMWCIVRPGPFICSEWDFGGLPAWLHRIPGIKLRQSHPAFLEATSRFFAAVMDQIRDLQVTAPSTPLGDRANHGNHPGQAACGYHGQGGGPILFMQAENEWFCNNAEEADKYLNELLRYLRENGCTVPINNCNNLWQPIDGTINTWNGARNLAIDMRQLAVVQPEAPRIVTEYWPGWFDHWGKEHSTVDPQLHLYRLAGILATGAQPSLYMFHGGTNFGFWGGRTVGNVSCYMTTSYDYDAPLLEAGGRGVKYALTKRLCTFASQFSGVFANLSAGSSHATVTPDEAGHPLCIMHMQGEQGDIVFLLRGAEDRTSSTRILLPNGLSIPVELGEDRAAWLLLNANLAGVATLDYTNLRPFAFLQRRALILFGPAGTEGIISLDGGQFHIRVPASGDSLPVVEKHNDLTLIVLSDEQTDTAYLYAQGLAIGSGGLDDEGQPIPLPRAQFVTISLDGQVESRRTPAARPPVAPKLGAWQHAALSDLVDGSAPGFRTIEGPDSLERLDADYGYGWYRIRIPRARSASKALAPASGDRMHVYSGGKLQNVLGLAPGAMNEPTSLRLSGDVVVLADNLGRFNYGQQVGERKGLFGHIYAVKPARIAKPRIVEERAADPFAVTGYVNRRRRGDLPMSRSYTWDIRSESREPIIVEFTGDVRGTLLLNGEPFAVYMGADSGWLMRFVLQPGVEAFRTGKNQLKFSLIMEPPKGANPLKLIRFYQATQTLTDGEWAFHPWGVPGAAAFGKPPRSLAAQPAWFRTTFAVSGTPEPLWLEPRGMTKGQIYLNGHNIGRYFVATRDKKRVPPQHRYYLPEPWLRAGELNELLLFDEHGASPARCRLAYDPLGPYNG